MVSVPDQVVTASRGRDGVDRAFQASEEMVFSMVYWLGWLKEMCELKKSD